MSSAAVPSTPRVGSCKRKTWPPPSDSGDPVRRLAAKLLQTQEEERRRIGRELHDGISQKLAVMVFETSRVAQDWEVLKDPQKELQTLRDLVMEVAHEIRALSHRMHPAVLEHLGLARALQVYCTRFEEHEGIRTRFVAGSFPPQDQDVCLGLYRIAQESLHNVSKHAHATDVEVRLERDGDCLRLCVSDNGKGFVPSHTRGKGIGLISVEERTRSLRGELSVQSVSGRGTTVSVRIPICSAEGKRSETRTTSSNRRNLANAWADDAHR